MHIAAAALVSGLITLLVLAMHRFLIRPKIVAPVSLMILVVVFFSRGTLTGVALADG